MFDFAGHYDLRIPALLGCAFISFVAMLIMFRKQQRIQLNLDEEAKQKEVLGAELSNIRKAAQGAEIEHIDKLERCQAAGKKVREILKANIVRLRGMQKYKFGKLAGIESAFFENDESHSMAICVRIRTSTYLTEDFSDLDHKIFEALEFVKRNLPNSKSYVSGPADLVIRRFQASSATPK